MYELERFFPKRSPMSRFEKVFEDLFSPLTIFASDAFFTPKVVLKEDESQYTFTVELPGVEKDKCTVEYDNGILMISGEKSEEKKEATDKFHMYEISSGKFCRRFDLVDVDAEKIDAKFKDGILSIVVPKIPPTKTVKQIEIKD